MLNTFNTEISETRKDAAAETRKHLLQHGASLSKLLDALDELEGIDALTDLHRMVEEALFDIQGIRQKLHIIHDVLAKQTLSKLDRISYKHCLPASDETRWHGARVGELLARFRHAK